MKNNDYDIAQILHRLYVLEQQNKELQEKVQCLESELDGRSMITTGMLQLTTELDRKVDIFEARLEAAESATESMEDIIYPFKERVEEFSYKDWEDLFEKC